LFCSDAFEEWLAVSAFVQVIAYHYVLGGFSYPSSVSVRWRVVGLKVLNVRSCPIVGLVLGYGMASICDGRGGQCLLQ